MLQLKCRHLYRGEHMWKENLYDVQIAENSSSGATGLGVKNIYRAIKVLETVQGRGVFYQTVRAHYRNHLRKTAKVTETVDLCKVCCVGCESRRNFLFRGAKVNFDVNESRPSGKRGFRRQREPPDWVCKRGFRCPRKSSV